MASRTLIIPAQAIAAGAVAAVLLLLIQSGVLVGVLVVPILPLAAIMWAGFTYGIIGLSSATLVATLLGMLLLDPLQMVLILTAQLFPAWLFMRELLKLRLWREGRIEWMPPGAAFAAVSLYGIAFFSLLMLFSPDAFDKLLRTLDLSWQETLQQISPESSPALERSGVNLPHMLLVFGLWGASLLLYAAACLANVVVLAYRRSLRPSLAFTPYNPPRWMLALFILSALCSVMQAGRLTILGQMVCLLLLLPYFISGLSEIHARLSRWQNPHVWLVGFYLLLLLTLWPVLPIAAYGLVRQYMRLLPPRMLR